MLVASPDYLARHGVPRSVADLGEHRGVVYTNRGAADWRFAGPDGAVTVRARSALRVNNGDVMRDAAVAGLGLALLPAFVAGAAVEAGQLSVVEIGVAAEDEFVFVAHAEGRRPSAKLRALVESLRRTSAIRPTGTWSARSDGTSRDRPITR